MKALIEKDLWKLYHQGNTICVTTNGFVKKNGKAVMGRGCAKECNDLNKGFSKLLGDRLIKEGNHVFDIGGILTFPVKHNWYEKADLELIKQSAEELSVFAESMDKDIYLPLPGCGNGKLSWEEVKQVLEPILPDNVIPVTHESTN